MANTVTPKKTTGVKKTAPAAKKSPIVEEKVQEVSPIEAIEPVVPPIEVPIKESPIEEIPTPVSSDYRIEELPGGKYILVKGSHNVLVKGSKEKVEHYYSQLV